MDGVDKKPCSKSYMHVILMGFLFSCPCFLSCTHFCPGSKLFLAFAQPLV